jgi:hypothetical protein
MQLDTQFKLKQNPYYVSYLRSNSYWYKTLTREPKKIDDFIQEYKKYNRQVKTSRLTETLEYIEMLTTIMSSLK